MPLVSVILPTYNGAAFLPRSIGSVVNQTFMDWELVVWDDGSSDQSKEIVRAYADDRIKYFWNTNHGVSHARNQAIQVAKGKYIAFLDSDDQWNSEKLEIQVNVLEVCPAVDVLFTDYLNINLSNGKKNLAFEQNARAMKLLDVEKIDENLFIIRNRLLESLTIENFIIPSSVILRHNVLEKVGLFNEELLGPEDFELWWRMGLLGVTFSYLGKSYVTRYKPPGSLSSISRRALENMLKALDFCRQETTEVKQFELLRYLNVRYRNTWQNLILVYADVGDIKGVFRAFSKSMKYGFSFGSLRLLFTTVLGFSARKL